MPIRNRIELENLLAIVNPISLGFFEAFKENRPCRLEMASEIARPTRGILLHREQLEKALILLTGCLPEEAILQNHEDLCKDAKSILKNIRDQYRELFDV